MVILLVIASFVIFILVLWGAEALKDLFFNKMDKVFETIDKNEKEKALEHQEEIDNQKPNEENSFAERMVSEGLKSGYPQKESTEARLSFLILTVASFYPTGRELFNLAPEPDNYSREEYREIRKNMYQIAEIALYLFFLADLLLFKCGSREERIKISDDFFSSLMRLVRRADKIPGLLCQVDYEYYIKLEKDVFYGRLISYSNIYKEKKNIAERMETLIEFQRNLLEDIIENSSFGERKYIINPTPDEYQPIHIDYIRGYSTSVKLQEYYNAVLPVFKNELKKLFPKIK